MGDHWRGILDSIVAFVPNIIGALLILILGWILALVLARLVRSLLRRTTLDEKIASLFKEEGYAGPDIVRGVGKTVFWIIMIIVFIAFFQALGLTLAIVPLNELLNEIFEFLPQLFGALILLAIAWVLATLLRMVVKRVMGAARVDERVGGIDEGDEQKGVPLTRSIGDAVYWLVFLLFLPAVLGALRLEGLLALVQGMLDKLLGYLPNIFAATIIAVIGWFVAKIARRVVTSLLAAAGSDRLSEKVGVVPLSGIVGLIVYILILIPVLIAALNALALEAVTRPASEMLNLILGALPSIFAAAMVLVISYVIGRVVAGLVTDLLTGIGFNSLPAKFGLGTEPEAGRTTVSQVAGYLVLVTIMFLAVFEASNLLGFEALSDLVAELTVFGGHILMGVVILAIGLYLAHLASRAIGASGGSQAGLLATIARVAIIVLATSIAIRHMGLANEIINLAFGLILGALAVAVAIAFGIGGRHVAARKLEEWSGSKRREG